MVPGSWVVGGAAGVVAGWTGMARSPVGLRFFLHGTSWTPDVG